MSMRFVHGCVHLTGFDASRLVYQMILEGSIGTHGAFARQVMNAETNKAGEIKVLLDALERATAVNHFKV